MISFPFIFFLIILLFSYKNKKTIFSMSFIVIFLYVFSFFMSIVIDLTDSYGYICPKIDINWITTIVFCSFLLYVIYPIIKFKDERIVFVKQVRNPDLFDKMVYLFVISSVLFYLISINDLINNFGLLVEDPALKNYIRSGDEHVTNLTGIIGKIRYLLVLISSASVYLILVFFYSLCFLKKSTMFNILILIASFSYPWNGMITLDRSKVIYWLMEFLLCFFFFRKYLTKKQLKIIVNTFAFILVGVGFYVFIINYLRFGFSSDSDSITYLISYSGQSFINFCNIYDNLILEEYTTLGIFPLTNYMLGNTESLTDWWINITDKTGIFVICFSTFMGEMLTEIGHFYTFIVVLVIGAIMRFFIPNKNIKEISLFRLFIIISLVNIPYLGIFAHYYHGWNVVLAAIIFGIWLYIIDKCKV